MKEIEVKVTKYIAEDGTQFDSKELCEKHDEECRICEETCNSRIAMILATRKKKDEEHEEYVRNQELKLEALIEHTKALKHRIQALVQVGNALRENGFMNAVAYKIGCLKLDGRSYSCGFSGRMEFTGVGFRFNEARFTTNGEEHKFLIGMCGDDGAELETKNKLVERFLEEFDGFEKRIYDWVDENMK